MEMVRESWTDARLDDFRAENSRRFDSLERRMEGGFNRVDGRIDDLAKEMSSRFDGLQRTMILFCGGIIASLLALVATQL